MLWHTSRRLSPKSHISQESRIVFVWPLMNQWYPGHVSSAIFKPIADLSDKRGYRLCLARLVSLP